MANKLYELIKAIRLILHELSGSIIIDKSKLSKGKTALFETNIERQRKHCKKVFDL